MHGHQYREVAPRNPFPFGGGYIDNLRHAGRSLTTAAPYYAPARAPFATRRLEPHARARVLSIYSDVSSR